MWGGSGAGALGLEGPVTAEAYEAIYGPGGARHPATGERLVSTQRPGMELVISAHKSVAELGVIGRAEHMHLIMDAERDATLAYLDRVTQLMGGRRARAQVVTPTSGLVYAHTRTPPPGPGIRVPMTMCCWRTWWRCPTSGAGGRPRTRRCGGSICTRRP
ncbi:MAG: relaxase domain-containing protein [Acidobacteriota bacterium]|nr:relaxase domain-containing protein [Acidobacteriota bacterium]